jgi:hypothetical protein
MTTAEMAAESDISESRILSQVQAREAVEGSGQFADIVLGSSETQFRERGRDTVNRILAGGSVLDVFHEETHGLPLAIHDSRDSPSQVRLPRRWLHDENHPEDHRHQPVAAR